MSQVDQLPLAKDTNMQSRVADAGIGLPSYVIFTKRCALRRAVGYYSSMIHVTLAARAQLLQLIAEHPDDPVVRLSIKDLEHERVAFSITLEPGPHPDDAVQNLDGLQVALEGQSAGRLDGITMDYSETDGFRFLHPGHAEQEKLRVINWN